MYHKMDAESIRTLDHAKSCKGRNFNLQNHSEYNYKKKFFSTSLKRFEFAKFSRRKVSSPTAFKKRKKFKSILKIKVFFLERFLKICRVILFFL